MVTISFSSFCEIISLSFLLSLVFSILSLYFFFYLRCCATSSLMACSLLLRYIGLDRVSSSDGPAALIEKKRFARQTGLLCCCAMACGPAVVISAAAPMSGRQMIADGQGWWRGQSHKASTSSLRFQVGDMADWSGGGR